MPEVEIPTVCERRAQVREASGLPEGGLPYPLQTGPDPVENCNKMFIFDVDYSGRRNSSDGPAVAEGTGPNSETESI